MSGPIPKFIVSFCTSVAIAASLAAPAQAGVTPPPAGGGTYVAVARAASGEVRIERLEVSSNRELSAEVAALDAAGDVLAVERDEPVRSLATGTDPLRDQQWSLDMVPFEASWPLANGQGVVVAVVDSGVDAAHEDLAGVVLPGWDAITNSPGGTVDGNGHGTHVAGIIAARTGNGAGTSGAAPGVQILPVRVLGTNGAGALSDVTEGIVWAVDHGADVINLSLANRGGAAVYRAVFGYARQHGVVVVSAAGNEALTGNPVVYPGADPDVIAVASVGPDGARAASSTWGSWVDVAAPGVGIVSACPGQDVLCATSWLPAGYASLSGTSMAAPHVAAAAALLLSAHPGLDPMSVQSVLQATAHDLGPAGTDPEYGAGLIDPFEALGGASVLPGAPAAGPAGPGPAGGYWVVGADGRVAAFGSAPDLGEVSAPNAAVVAAAAIPTGGGYWLAGADGGIFAFGDAPFLGSLGGLRLNSPIVGLATTPTGAGYWLLGADGGVFSFGDARFFGSTGGITLNQPVVDMAPTPSGGGYWLVARDGGIFAFGDAEFLGSTGGIALSRPVASMAATDGGYWMVAGDGGIFAFGSAAYQGSLPGLAASGLPEGRRIRAPAAGGGYYVLGGDGRVFAFGAAPPHGSAAGLNAVDLVVAP